MKAEHCLFQITRTYESSPLERTHLFFRKTFLVLLILLMVSCQKELSISWPEPEPGIVVDCLFSSDKPFDLKLSYINAIEDTLVRKVADAEVVIFEENIVFDTLCLDNKGHYSGDSVPKSGYTYQLLIKHPDFGVITAESYIPQSVIPDSIHIIDTAGIHQWGKPYSQANVTFQDPVDMENFYEISAFYIDTTHGIHGSEIIWQYSANDPVLTNEGMLEYDPQSLVFSDELINGFLYTLRVPLEFITNFKGLDCRLTFFSASQEYYLFKRNMAKHVYNQGGRQLDLLIISAGNPVPPYSNIDNGYGVFAGFSTYEKKIN